MNDETSLGGSGRAFPETSLGLAARLAAPDRAGLADLCRRYWKPVYWYARIAWARSNEDAKDLAQAFFAWLVEDGAIGRYAPERGALRSYLKVLLRRFLGHQDLRDRRLKRGGGSVTVPLGDAGAPPSGDPDEAFDRAWASSMTAQAVERVRARCEGAGRGTQFRVFELYDMARDGAPPTYAGIEARLALRAGQARDFLAAVRRAVREEIRAELARTTGGGPALEEEWNALLAR